MVTAITIWGDRISPVFDSASAILIVEIIENRIVNRSTEMFSPGFLNVLTKRLNELNVSTIICGAISEAPAHTIENKGFHLIPFITGSVTEVLLNYEKGESITPKFLMPGCKCQKRKRGRCCKNR
ncbi:MAG: dinitrogenase iron-molybdenum cofactor biosynthesis domain-containing protein [Desulfobacterales bacterium]|nr:dinitrogenase iron-molybdenum cofactor biosynthesis domain-containing protein [Desulfobacterales bacterium]MCP4160403.1 dinitrogenase iron-molybdenum cofactor biosynthesis domain-containing protein [Deltaproteobacteria bacterium]